MTRFNLSFAGAGRVAGALCKEMFNSGFKIIQVVSENESDGKPLAEFCHASWSSELIFNNKNDIIIVAVPDHKLKDVLSQLKYNSETIIVHTAGSFGLEIFPASIKRTGVFYPLQTFSKGRIIRFKDLPILLEASEKDVGQKLKNLTESIGGKMYFVDNERRRIIHLAAVFVNNFTNYMLTAGKELISDAGLSFQMFEPLIKETISKALEEGPERSQTGPAVRNDLNTIEKHLELLSFSPDLQNIYKEITNSIIKRYKSG